MTRSFTTANKKESIIESYSVIYIIIVACIEIEILADADNDPGNELQYFQPDSNRLTATWDEDDLANKRYVDKVFEQIEKDKIQEHDNFMWYGETWGKFYDPANDELYRFTQIGDQVWMAENLRGTRYSDGDSISSSNYALYPPHDMNGDGDTTAKDMALYRKKFGYLYKHYGIYNDEKLDVICPDGWKLPTNNDFFKLIGNTGGKNNAGGELKAAHTWSDTTNLDDEYGFSALPAKAMNSDKIPWTIEKTYFITNNGVDFGSFVIYNGATNIEPYPNGNIYFYSIRCIKQ